MAFRGTNTSFSSWIFFKIYPAFILSSSPLFAGYNHHHLLLFTITSPSHLLLIFFFNSDQHHLHFFFSSSKSVGHNFITTYSIVFFSSCWSSSPSSSRSSHLASHHHHWSIDYHHQLHRLFSFPLARSTSPPVASASSLLDHRHHQRFFSSSSSVIGISISVTSIFSPLVDHYHHHRSYISFFHEHSSTNRAYDHHPFLSLLGAISAAAFPVIDSSSTGRSPSRGATAQKVEASSPTLFRRLNPLPSACIASVWPWASGLLHRRISGLQSSSYHLFNLYSSVSGNVLGLASSWFICFGD